MQFISLPNDVYSFAELNRLSLSQCRFKYLYQIWNAGLNLKSRICIRLIQMFCWWHLCLWRLLAYVSSSYLKIRPPVYAVQDKRSSMLDPKLSERHTGSTNGFGNKVKKAAALMERWSVSLKARFLKRKLLQRLICVLPMKTWRRHDDASQLLQYQSKVLLGGIGLLPVYINMILKEGEELTVSILWSPPPQTGTSGKK